MRVQEEIGTVLGGELGVLLLLAAVIRLGLLGAVGGEQLESALPVVLGGSGEERGQFAGRGSLVVFPLPPTKTGIVRPETYGGPRTGGQGSGLRRSWQGWLAAAAVGGYGGRSAARAESEVSPPCSAARARRSFRRESACSTCVSRPQLQQLCLWAVTGALGQSSRRSRARA